MNDSEIIRQLISDRINLESNVNDLSEALRMCLNFIEKGQDKSNYARSDVTHTSYEALRRAEK